MSASPKSAPVRDRKYLDSQHKARCAFTGLLASDFETIDPMHVGTNGMGSKAGDDETIPVLHHLHAVAHQKGLAYLIRNHAPSDLLAEMALAWCHERYRAWKNGSDR